MTTFEQDLVARTMQTVCDVRPRRIALLGWTPAALATIAALRGVGLEACVVGIFDDDAPAAESFSKLVSANPDLIVVCHDAEKAEWLVRARNEIGSSPHLPHVVIAGIQHLEFRDPLYAELDAPALVPSYATGSPYTREHLYQCLLASAAAGLSGAIVEFGAFKGGTTAWLAQVARRLGLSNSDVIGFDTWDGFPPRASILDLYEHPRCVFRDVDAVRAYTEPYGVALVEGDISLTYDVLSGMPLLLSFFDTDNYSPARAALTLCAEQTVVGGSIVFDHVATLPDYIDTIGERIAAEEVLGGGRYLHLHGTGVYTRIA